MPEVGNVITREFPVKDLKIVRNWLPAHGRYWKFLGLVLEEKEDHVKVQVYGPCQWTPTTAAVAAVRIR